MEYHSTSSQNTQEIGKQFGSTLKGGEVVALSGDLGAGKTTFVQGLAQGLGLTDRIISPTFIIVRSYNLKDEKTFHHIDLYRLEDNFESEMKNLGISDFIGKDDSIVVIEWPEKAKEFLPEKTIWISIEGEEDERKITIKK